MNRDAVTLEDLLAQAQWMRGLARRLLTDADDADDIVQETWLRAMRVPPDRGLTLRPWIATVMRNLVRSRLRSDARARAREADYSTRGAAPSAEDLLVERHTERRLAELVLDLEEPFRHTVLARFHEGRSAAQIARNEGVPEGTVRWRLKRGLDVLRDRLDRQDDLENGLNRKALAVLLPLAVPPPLPEPVTTLAHWLAKATLAKGTAVLTAAGAITAVAAATIVAVTSPTLTRPTAVRPVATAPPLRASSPAPSLPTSLPAATGDQQPHAAAAVPVFPIPSVVRPPTGLKSPPPKRSEETVVVGVVRDGGGGVAPHVPVTIRTLSGSGAAERTTTTDDEGRFHLQLRPHSRFLVTAELKGEPAARIEIDVPSPSGISVDPGAQGADTATIEVALDPKPRRSPSLIASMDKTAALLSRWCCRQAYLDRDRVHGRGCLKFDEASAREQSGCELYGLKAQVSCHHYTEGGLSTGDLTRTEALACDGRLM